MLAIFLVCLYLVIGLVCSFLSMVYVDTQHKLRACYWSNDERIPFHIASFVAWPIVGAVLLFICLITFLASTSELVAGKIADSYKEFLDKSK